MTRVLCLTVMAFVLFGGASLADNPRQLPKRVIVDDIRHAMTTMRDMDSISNGRNGVPLSGNVAGSS